MVIPEVFSLLYVPKARSSLPFLIDPLDCTGAQQLRKQRGRELNYSAKVMLSDGSRQLL